MANGSGPDSGPEVFDEATLELVNAYLDGEMDMAGQVAFEERLSREPGLRQLLEGMRRIDVDLSSAFGATPAAPPSEALLAAVKDFAAAQTIDGAQTGTNVVGFPQRARNTRYEPAMWRLPIAACLALFAGAGGMWLFQSLQGPQNQGAAVAIVDGVVAPTTALHAALERTSSGDVLVEDGERIRPVLSFASKDGRVCREFDAASAKSAVVGVACKDERGWKIELLLAAAPHVPDETQYAPASGFNSKALDDVVSQLMDGQPLAPDVERALRDKGWQGRAKPVP